MTTEKHREQMRTRYRRLRAIGICAQCGGRFATGCRCDRCAPKHNEPRRKAQRNRP